MFLRKKTIIVIPNKTETVQTAQTFTVSAFARLVISRVRIYGDDLCFYLGLAIRRNAPTLTLNWCVTADY